MKRAIIILYDGNELSKYAQDSIARMVMSCCTPATTDITITEMTHEDICKTLANKSIKSCVESKEKVANPVDLSVIYLNEIFKEEIKKVKSNKDGGCDELIKAVIGVLFNEGPHGAKTRNALEILSKHSVDRIYIDCKQKMSQYIIKLFLHIAKICDI